MKRLHRYLLSFALVVVSLGFAWASYAREGMTPLEVLPTLATATPWQEAGLPLAVVALSCALLTALAGRHRALRLEPALLVQGAATFAAALTYSYDLCQDAGLSWLPAFGGCHCWLTGAAAILAGALSTLVIFTLGLFSVRLIRQLISAVAAYLRRALYRPFAGRVRRLWPRYSLLARVRLIAFRGPPTAPSAIFLRF